MMKLILSALMLLLTSQPYAAKPLVIGSSPLNPPFETLAEKPNHFYGFDTDIMMEICRRIKRECVFQPVMFNSLFPAINTGKLDLAISAIIITHDREDYFLFSLPYFESNGQFITLKSSDINKPDDIRGKIVGTRLGAPYGLLAYKIYKDDVKVKEYPLINDLMIALNKGEVDAALMDGEAAKYWAYNVDSTQYELIGTKLPVGKGYGIMANKGQAQLMDQINKALLSMEEDGTYLQIYKRYIDLQ